MNLTVNITVFLGCDTVKSGNNLPTFRKKLLFTSYGWSRISYVSFLGDQSSDTDPNTANSDRNFYRSSLQLLQTSAWDSAQIVDRDFVLGIHFHFV